MPMERLPEAWTKGRQNLHPLREKVGKAPKQPSGPVLSDEPASHNVGRVNDRMINSS
jgi:hypothetical protein